MSLIKCKAGLFEGLLQDSCYLFFGIPYAKYEQRWDDSTLIDKEINFKAIEIGNSAPQTRPADQGQLGTSFFQDNSLSKQSEDCLTLNICSNDIKAKNPVLIWIHGGALRYGSGDVYLPDGIVPKGNVLVTINYRLGELGFFAHPSINDSDQNYKTNFGLLDQIILKSILISFLI